MKMRLLVFLFIILMACSMLVPINFYPITKDDTDFLAQVVNALDKSDAVWIAGSYMLYPLLITESNRTQIV